MAWGVSGGLRGPASLPALLALWLLVVLASKPARALCGDCNDDGRVAVNELVEAVGNALAGDGATTRATPTSLPNRCPDFRPGLRLHVGETTFLLVEIAVTLEGASGLYALRYPVELGGDGRFTVPASIRLARYRCSDPDFSCPDPLRPASICGFRAFQGTWTSGPASSYTEDEGSYSVNSSFVVNGAVWLVIDESHEPFRVTLSASLTSSRSVQPFSAYRYSMLTAPYQSPPVDAEELIEQMEALLQSVSVRRID